MRHETQALDVRAALQVGDAIKVADYYEKTVQFSGTFTATVQVQGSMDGTNFVNIGSALTAPGIVEVSPAVVWLRVSTTAFTSGTPLGVFGGFNSRTDL